MAKKKAKVKKPKRLRVVGNQTTKFKYVVELIRPGVVTVRKETQTGKGKGTLRKFKSK